MAEFPAREEQLAAVLAYTERRCAELGLRQEVGLRALLIVEELFVNTALYGDCGGQPVDLELALDSGLLMMRYEDCGRAFDPFSQLPRAAHEKALAERPVGGLGVVLIDGFSTRRQYLRRDGRNCLRLWLAPD